MFRALAFASLAAATGGILWAGLALAQHIAQAGADPRAAVGAMALAVFFAACPALLCAGILESRNTSRRPKPRAFRRTR